MIERLRLAVWSYGSWLVVWLVMFLAWSSFMLFYPQRIYLSLSEYFIYLNLVLVPCSLFFGYKLRDQLIPARSKLIPDWTTSHVVVALGSSTLLAASVAVVARLSLNGNLELDRWQSISISGLFGLAWFEVLLLLFVGYLGHPVIFLALAIVAGFAGFGGDRFYQLFSMIVNGSQPIVTLLLIALDAAGARVLLRRIPSTLVEMSELELNVFNFAEAQRRYWASDASDRGVRHRLWEWTTRSLDAIPPRVGEDLLSQIRHFQLGIMVSRGFMAIPVVLVLTFWILDRSTGIRIIDSDILMLQMLYPVAVLFRGKWATQKDIFQWMFVLPRARRVIVTRFLGAMFLSTLKLWLLIHVAVFVVKWMPFPGVIRDLPALLPFLESFSALLPLFAIMSLVLIRPKGERARSAVAAVAACVILTIVIAVVIARSTGIHDPEPVFTMAAFITGIGMIWYSYRSWLQADLV